MREFILLALKAKTSPDFDNLVISGKMDLVCRTIANSLFIANSMRRDTKIHICLQGPPVPPKIISFDGAELRGLEPNEEAIIKVIKKALGDGLNLELNEEVEAMPGVKIIKKSFEALVKEKAETSQLIYLHPEGKQLREFKFRKNVTFVLGDFIGLPRKTEKLLDRIGAKRITISPLMLFASHCPIIVHNELDIRKIV